MQLQVRARRPRLARQGRGPAEGEGGRPATHGTLLLTPPFSAVRINEQQHGPPTPPPPCPPRSPPPRAKRQPPRGVCATRGSKRRPPRRQGTPKRRPPRGFFAIRGARRRPARAARSRARCAQEGRGGDGRGGRPGSTPSPGGHAWHGQYSCFRRVFWVQGSILVGGDGRGAIGGWIRGASTGSFGKRDGRGAVGGWRRSRRRARPWGFRGWRVRRRLQSSGGAGRGRGGRQRMVGRGRTEAGPPREGWRRDSASNQLWGSRARGGGKGAVDEPRPGEDAGQRRG